MHIWARLSVCKRTLDKSVKLTTICPTIVHQPSFRSNPLKSCRWKNTGCIYRNDLYASISWVTRTSTLWILQQNIALVRQTIIQWSYLPSVRLLPVSLEDIRSRCILYYRKSDSKLSDTFLRLAVLRKLFLKTKLYSYAWLQHTNNTIQWTTLWYIHSNSCCAGCDITKARKTR